MSGNTITRQEAAKELQARRKARMSLLDFTLYTKPDYEANWHHVLLCEYLDAWMAGDIKRLLVCMPPQHGKSELVSRRMPAMLLGMNPNERFVLGSYSADLANSMNRDVQRIMESEAYQMLYPDSKLKNNADGNVSKYKQTDSEFEIVGYEGSYKSVGIGGGLSGRPMTKGAIDDPLKDARDASSPTMRQRAWEWYTDVFWTRQSKDASILVTMTRWHMGDLVGLLKDAMLQDDGEQFEILVLPAILEDEVTKHPKDPRKVGEALWEDRHPLSRLQKARSQNMYSFSALYQQTPIPHGDAIFDTSKIEIIDSIPECNQVVRFYDLAVTAKKHSDYTVGVKMGITNTEDVIILDVYRVQKIMPEVEKDIIRNATDDSRVVPIRLEGEKAGIVQLDYLLLRPELRHHVIDTKAPTGDKYTRAQPFATRVNNGKVKMIRAGWNRAFTAELEVFPLGNHDDQVDACSGAYDMLSYAVDFAFPNY